MVAKTFNQGDIVMMNFDPTAGHEQRGLRPAVVVSNNTLNKRSSLIMVCPITSTNKIHPFHIPLDDRTKTTGVILCEQAKMLDINARNAKRVERLPGDIVREVIELIYDFLREE